MVVHLEVLGVDDLLLLTQQELLVAGLDPGRVAGVDVLPRLVRRAVERPGLVQLLDRLHAALAVGLVHGALVAEDVLLHAQQRDLVELEVVVGQ
ncbi:hypothetical protein [Nocardioides daphniae]|uniref:hypothetical protein n=1 Tax=Nocardioides daphniae TaxID=402297 RepID=UPI00131548EE|nr:hypothetical protein [Nocardioides daphniae]